MKPGIISLYLLSTITLCNVSSSSSIAQISSDGTLSTTVTSDDGINFLIENGDRFRNDVNLFHSFSEFSIPNLGSAYFNNSTDIVNIFSRVTGGNISDIQGLIRANGTANLFLINPAGIVFGENASLDIGGSFFATTAESVVFGDGIEFSATEPESAPLLTVNITPGLQMGTNPGNITVRGNGHNQTYPQISGVPFDRSNNTRGLEVPFGQTISLVGGSIFFESGVLTAESGRINLGAVGNNRGLINLNLTDTGWQLGYEGITNFGNIQLSERSLVDASGISSGSIHLQGQQIELLNASALLIQNVGNQNAGTIQVNATDALVMEGNSLGGLAISELRSETLGDGKSADIAVETQKLTITDGAQIGVRTFGSGSGGNINILAADRIEIRGFSPSNPAIGSFIGTVNYALAGNSGDVLISTGQLNMFGGGLISSVSFGVGAGGNLTINATESVELSDVNPFILVPSNISVLAFGSGDAGRLTVNTEEVTVKNGAQITSATLASGSAGSLTINASKFVEVEGQFVSSETTSLSQISAASDLSDLITRQVFGLPPFPTGESGNLTINTPTLRVLNGALVLVRNDGTSGNAGNLKIDADSVFLDNQGSLSATARDGQGGNINLTTNNLDLSDRAIISVSSLGSGQAGNLTINANSLSLENQSSLQAEVTAGNQGNIILNSQLLLLRNNSNITTNAGNQANGGNITIETVNLVALENSYITANAIEGQGGNIIITAQGLFLYPDSEITASSEFGVDGVVTINNPEADESAALLELPTDTIDASQQIAEGCAWVRHNSFIVTGRGGTPKNPSNILINDQMWSDMRDLSNNQSDVTSQKSSDNHSAVIEANTWIVNEQDNVELVAIVNSEPILPLTNNCAGSADFESQVLRKS